MTHQTRNPDSTPLVPQLGQGRNSSGVLAPPLLRTLMLGARQGQGWLSHCVLRVAVAKGPRAGGGSPIASLVG